MRDPDEISTATEAEETGRNMVERLGPWFQNLHLLDGTETAPGHPLGDYPAFKWRRIAPHLPDDLAGCRALEIGCNAGYYAIELARRGASVLALDHDPFYLEQARWALAQFPWTSRVELHQMDVYDLPRLPDVFDIVLFMGVFYHLRHPLLALEHVAAKVNGLLVFQTMSLPGDEVLEAPEDLPLDERAAMLDPGWPKMAFVEHAVAGDATNWWVPNHAAILALLRSVGLTVRARPAHEIYIATPASATEGSHDDQAEEPPQGPQDRDHPGGRGGRIHRKPPHRAPPR